MYNTGSFHDIKTLKKQFFFSAHTKSGENVFGREFHNFCPFSQISTYEINV